MIMAAGLGTRLRPFTEKVAKPLLPLMGVPTAQYALDQLKRTSTRNAVANVHHLADPSSQGLRFLDFPGELSLSDESHLLLGSAGGIAKAAEQFESGPFFILNADTVCNAHLQDLAKHHLLLRNRYGVSLTLLLFKKAPTAGDYSEILIDDRRSLIRGIGERRQARTFYSGIGVLEKEVLKDIPTDAPSEFVPRILEPAIRTGKAGAFIIDNSIETDNARWFDIGSPELWRQAHLDWMRLYEQGELPSIWCERILKANRRVAENIWVSNRVTGEIDVSKWSAPCYWSPDGADASPPERLAAGTVLYGKSPFPPGSTPLPGIGFRGLWKSL
jgi:mannose-1-phosphate guanylyltransferase